MKLIIRTSKERTYLMRLPNYIDHEKIPGIVQDVTKMLRNGEQVVSHSLHSDQYHTDAERKEYDVKGKVTTKMIELPYLP